MNGCKPIVPRGHCIVSLPLQVIQETMDGVSRQIFQRQTDTGFPVTPGGKLQEELPGIAVGQHGVTAQTSLGDQVLIKEAPNQFSKIRGFHGVCPGWREEW